MYALHIYIPHVCLYTHTQTHTTEQKTSPTLRFCFVTTVLTGQRSHGTLATSWFGGLEEAICGNHLSSGCEASCWLIMWGYAWLDYDSWGFSDDHNVRTRNPARNPVLQNVLFAVRLHGNREASISWNDRGLNIAWAAVLKRAGAHGGSEGQEIS